jgi:phosphoadenosine phosphosulfate reductase
MSLPPDLLSAAEDAHALHDLNEWLGARGAPERVEWALHTLPGEHALSSSFGAQSAAILHLITHERTDIPVILVDTGYLFPETYRFADELTARLGLNLKVYRPTLSIAWMEARFGRLWEQGIEGIDRYNRLRKVEPMRRALDELGARTWIAGLRRGQTEQRKNIDFLELRDSRWKFHPVADWTDRDVWNYLQSNNLPYHPLWERGYISIGDVHTTLPWQPGMREEDTRFFGLRRECGLHFDMPASAVAAGC